MAILPKATGGIKVLHFILVVLVLFSVVPIAFVGWQLISINSDTLQSKEKNYQVQTVRNKARQIELYVQGYIAQVHSFTHAFEITGNLSTAMSAEGQERLAEIIEEDASLLALAVATSDNLSNISVANNSNKITPQEVKESLFEAAEFIQNGKTHIGAPRILPTYREPSLTIAQPIKRQGKIEGVVLAVISLQKVFSMVSQKGNLDEWKLLHGENTIFFVVDNNGVIIAHPDEQLAFQKQDSRYLKVVRDWIESNQMIAVTSAFSLTRNQETLRLLGSFASAQLDENMRLGVIALVNEDAAYLSAQKMRNRTLVISGVTAFVAIIVGLFFARGFSNPIEQLAENARAIAKGDYSRRIQLKTHNLEISELATDFNLMSDQVQRHIRTVEEAAEKNRRMFLGSVKSLAAAIDGKDPYTRGHSERVMVYSHTIAELMGLPADEVEKIRISALLHDVGKIGIEDRILRKPAALTDQEFQIMKNHPRIGGTIMSENPEMAEYIPGMSMHHETMDGKGYPLGLKGEQIPMMARIVSVADCFDAMTTNRPYQRAMTFEVAIDRINTFIGTRYDENVVRALETAIVQKRIKPDPRVNNVPDAAESTAA